MSQAMTIYDYLSASDTPAADKALVHALRRAEEPYLTVIFETLLERGSEETAELVNNYDNYAKPWQDTMVNQITRLHRGLRKAARGGHQARQNCLSIIRYTGDLRLADVVVNLLSDRTANIGQRAGNVLLSMAEQIAKNHFAAPRTATSSDEAEKAILIDSDFAPANTDEIRVNFRSALSRGVRNYNIHRRPEALLAAMYVVPADDEEFWGETLHNYTPSGAAVQELVRSCSEPAAAKFCISALGHIHLRSSAAHSINKHTRPGFIIAVAEEFERNHNEAICKGLRMVRHPQWLNHAIMPTKGLTKDELGEILELIGNMSAGAEQVCGYLEQIIDTKDAQVAGRVLRLVKDLPVQASVGVLMRALQSSHPTIALAAGKILNNNASQVPSSVLSKLLTSPHEAVQELGRSRFRSVAFEQYWKKFERMAPKQQKTTGQAVFKIDPDAYNCWRSYAHSGNPEQRLRAVQMVKVLEDNGECVETLMELANDSDRMVRSSAVAALGRVRNMSRELEIRTEQCLMEALNDRDTRVQANAVEALEERNAQGQSEIIEKMTNSSNNRVRANAIKTLLEWKVESVRQALDKMLTDGRPPHRLSAQWVLKQLEPQKIIAQPNMEPVVRKTSSGKEMKYADFIASV